MSADAAVMRTEAQAEDTVRCEWVIVPQYFEAMARRMLGRRWAVALRKPAKAKGGKKR